MSSSYPIFLAIAIYAYNQFLDFLIAHELTQIVDMLITIYCKLFKVEKLAVAEMNCDSLRNIHSCKVHSLVWANLLQRALLLFHCKKFFVVTNRSTKTMKLFHLDRFAIYSKLRVNNIIM